MALKTKIADPPDKEVSLEVSVSPEPEVAPRSGPVPGEVFVLNLTPSELDITLTDGTNLSIGPATRDGKYNKSRVIPKKLLPPYVRRLESAKQIRIVDASA